MPTFDADKLLESVAEALQTLAFIAAEPLLEPQITVDQVQVVLAFGGPLSGEVRLVAPQALGILIAENLLISTRDAADISEKALDALQELTNITTGLLFRQLCDPSQMPLLSVPVITPVIPGEFLAGANCSGSLSAEGHAVSIAIKAHP